MTGTYLLRLIDHPCGRRPHTATKAMADRCLVRPLEHYGKTRPTRVWVGRTRDSPAIFYTAIVLLF